MKEQFMKKAIEDARMNGHRFGAVMVKNNKIISKSGNRPKKDSRYHAEMQAINNISEKLKGDFKGGTLYSTCKPCPMCFYMAWVNQVPKIIFGASISDSINAGILEINITANELNQRSGKKIEIREGLLRNECIKLLRGR